MKKKGTKALFLSTKARGIHIIFFREHYLRIIHV